MLVSVSNLYAFVLTFGAISYVTPRVAPFFAFNSPISDQNSVSLQSYEKDEEICVPDCNSTIFCDGEILHDVQMSGIYQDDLKTFVDLKLRFSEAEIIKKYKALKQKCNGQVSYDQMIQFVNESFYYLSDQHSGLEKWQPKDFKKNPSIVERIRDDKYKKFALELNEIWKELAVKVSADVRDNQDRYSLIYLPNGFIKAGGRFREMYYWDSYWIIRGLLLCDMPDTVRGIIGNMIHLVQKFGYVPNGSRWYYSQRSQPPLLIQMASSYYSSTKDDAFIRDNLEDFEKEFLYWHTNRLVEIHKNGRVYKLARYNAVSCTPRPESYRIDFNDAAEFSKEEKKRFFTGIKSGAESGWDFSSRHIRAPDNSNNAGLNYIETQSFVYVDLNSMLHANAFVLSEWFGYFGNKEKANKYKKIANELQEAIDNVLWNEEVGMWLDWDWKMKKSRDYYYASNLTPLWTGSYNKTKSGLVEKVIEYLKKNKVIGNDLSFPYWAVPTSMNTTKSTQQWDFPNGWAPLQAFVMQGLERTEHPAARNISFNMAQKWIETTYAGLHQKKHQCMFEKYHVINFGESGKGGEYAPEKGFGWTNGFVLEVLDTWGQDLVSKPE